jgi:NitT/TauT family transport system substrate-binding protein
MKRRHRLLHFGLVAIACLLSIILGCSQSITTPLRVGINTWPGYEPLYLAQSLELYGNQPIQVIIYPSTTESIRAYRNGQLDVVAVTLDETLLLKQTDSESRAFWVTDISHGADALLSKPEIRDLSELKGKRVGVETTALGAYVLTRALAQANLSVNDIQIVVLDVSEHKQAYLSDKVDAVITFEPNRTTLMNAGAHILFDSSDIPNEIVDVLVTHQELIENRSKILTTLVQGWLKALDYMRQNSDDAIGRMARRQGITSEEFAATLKLLQLSDLADNQVLLSKDSSLKRSLETLNEVMLEHQLIQKSVDPNSILVDTVVNSLP